ncbi:hypothetical protein [Paracidovorax sp. MALMAid1276]|uniref:hypothetical protein n=1 Tax=Paracidovorax sp. MALMAid1276 TaxID=3411631 RepID=UPI003B9D7126
MQSDQVAPTRPGRARGARWPVAGAAVPLLGLALLGAGCAAPDVPQDSRHAPSTQKTMRAVHHWDVLAQDMASRIADKTRDWPAGQHPIYVASKADTRFNHGFRKLLMARLADLGVTVSTEPATAVHLVVEAQVVQHLQPQSSALHWVPLASGVSVARDGVHFHGAHSFSAQGAAGAPAAGAMGADPRASALQPGRAAPAAAEREVIVAPGSAFGAAVAAIGPTGPSGPATASAGSASGYEPAPSAIRRAPPAPETPVVYPQPGVPARSEVLVTASLESGGRYLAGTSDVYSLAHDDALLYLAPEPRLPGPPSAAIKTWRVVAPW